MRITLFSDIYANLLALKALLKMWSFTIPMLFINTGLVGKPNNDNRNACYILLHSHKNIGNLFKDSSVPIKY